MNIFFLIVFYAIIVFLIILLLLGFGVSNVKLLPIVLPIILMVALFTLLERKILAGVQRRRGPNVVGLWGILQPFSDAFKLIFKETIIPGLSNIILFVVAPIFTFALSLLSWSVLPFSYGIVVSDINLGLMFIFSISSLGVYGIVISGWSSNSKYAFLGSLRSAAQFISYEVVMAVTIMSVIICVGSLNITSIIQMQSNFWFIFAFWPSFLMFFISSLAETNRIPYDLPEAESELVSGYNVEYAATTFVLFFLAEYSNILIMSVLITLFFFGGWNLFFYIPFVSYWFIISVKVLCIVILFILIRATLPRYRYDNLMNVGWKVLLPISLVYFLFTAFYYFVFNVTFIF